MNKIRKECVTDYYRMTEEKYIISEMRQKVAYLCYD